MTTARDIVFVTGGASGIGLAIARAVLAHGWQAVVADVNPDNLARARETLGNPAAAHVQPLDVADERAVVAAMARCEMEIGPLAGLVNSAGIGSDMPCLDTTTELFRKTLEVNLIGSFVACREAARFMKNRGKGAIVNIASISALRGNRGRVAYGASKAGVIAMTQVMAVELASCGIRVNAIAPGPVDTPLVGAMHTQEARQAWTKVVPQRRYAAADEIAGAAIFLLDAAQSSFVTGQTICVDGGFTAAGLIDTA